MYLRTFRPGLERRSDVAAIPNAATSEVCPAVVMNEMSYEPSGRVLVGGHKIPI